LTNGKKMDAVEAYADVINAESAMRVQVDADGEGPAWGGEMDPKGVKDKDPREGIIDIREYDVPYYLRVAIDDGKRGSTAFVVIPPTSFQRSV